MIVQQPLSMYQANDACSNCSNMFQIFMEKTQFAISSTTPVLLKVSEWSKTRISHYNTQTAKPGIIIKSSGRL